ncbi:MAG: hypothetical protein CMM15_05680 [Rhodospirillaceae bacterium]|nr:hypothetical protein [Rhodospirillaceae bacterium]|tara:strand:- start:1837 stop:2295 length:459 start_codon:yes stop_codon:yes gene_type:complete
MAEQANIIWTANPILSVLNNPEVINAPSYFETGTNLIFAGGVVAGTAISLVDTENDLCDMQGNIKDIQEQLSATKSSIASLSQFNQEEFETLTNDINDQVNAAKLYSKQINQLQNSAISKKVIAVVLVFVFNLSILGSLFIKRLLANQKKEQ